jgi:uncharacterized integral membrane protein (TIGR00698 family)
MGSNFVGAMRKEMLKPALPGFLLVLGLAMLAFVAYPYIPGANEVLLGLLFGVALGNFVELPARYRDGVDLTGKEGLNLSIIFLGFGISFQHIAALGWGMLGLLIIVVLVMLVLTYILARVFRCRTSTGWLVGFGTAICGSSAIAALAGSVSKEKEDAGIAIAVVNLLGLAGMLLLPLGLQFVDHSETMAATLLGGTLHAVGNVAGAGYSISDPVGDLAITVKLGRVALLAPGLIFFNYLVNRSASFREHLRLPYYIWGFILAVSVVTFLPLPTALLGGLKMTGKVLLTLAMTAIGMKISVRKLFQMGRVAMGFGVVVFVLQIALVVLLAWAFGLGS